MATENAIAPAVKSKRTSLGRLGVVLLVLAACASGGLWLIGYFKRSSIQQLQEQCQDLRGEKNWSELAEVSKRWTSAEPGSADAWLFRSEAAEGLQEWAAMADYLGHVPRTDRRAAGSLLRKSIVEFEKLNLPWQGIKTCDEVLELEPRVMVAHKQTIFFFMMSLQRAEAVRRIRRAIRVRRESPESYVFLVSANWLYPGSLYRTNNHWLQSDPDSEIFQVARAMQVYSSDAKNDPGQTHNFEHVPPPEELFQKYPHNIELLAYFLNNGMANGELERVEELLEAFPADIAETDARYFRAKAWCEDVRGEFDQAEQSLKRAYSLDRYWWHIHFQLHDLYRRLGRLDESEQFFKIYKISKELSTEITSLNDSPESLDHKKFCRELLVIAELIDDQEVVSVLRERVAAQ